MRLVRGSNLKLSAYWVHFYSVVCACMLVAAACCGIVILAGWLAACYFQSKGNFLKIVLILRWTGRGEGLVKILDK